MESNYGQKFKYILVDKNYVVPLQNEHATVATCEMNIIRLIDTFSNLNYRRC